MNPVAQIIKVKDGEDRYHALMIWCPGCEYTDSDGHKFGGLHMLPVSGDASKRPTWDWNKDLVVVTLNPSILTKTTRDQNEFVCHSLLQEGRWQFLSDCTHELANQTVEMVPLPDWVTRV